jgi:hypothetical protein
MSPDAIWPDQCRIKYGAATVSWGPRPYGNHRIIANAPIDAWNDLLEAIRIAKSEAAK